MLNKFSRNLGLLFHQQEGPTAPDICPLVFHLRQAGSPSSVSMFGRCSEEIVRGHIAFERLNVLFLGRHLLLKGLDRGRQVIRSYFAVLEAVVTDGK